MTLHRPSILITDDDPVARETLVLPVILITAEQDENLLRKALSANAFCVLAKPVSKNVIIYVVSRALAKYYD
jgi:CheY-like chemotaxis protein